MFGLFPLPWWGYIVVILSMTQITVLATTIYLHRCQAHRSLNLHPIVSHFFRFWLWMTTGIITKEWAAIHRKHHARVETVEDPHSPQTRGIKKVFFEGAELYREESHNKETMQRFGEGTPDDWMERNVYNKHSTLGITLMFAIDILFFGSMGLTIWALQMAWIPFFAAGFINGIGHFWGYRNYECKDASRNIIPFGILLGGEELHNNHHAFATSAKFSTRWWEIDTGWWLIRALQAVGLAMPKRVVPEPKFATDKTCVDIDTVKALITYRFQVMSRYTREVVLPELKREKQQASKTGRDLLAHAKTMLIRDTSLIKETQQARLRHVLENFQSLGTVYQFRTKLQEIWNRNTASPKELLEALQEWCQQAEASGIEALNRFVRTLKTYVPHSA